MGGKENNITVLQMVRIEAGPVISGNNQIPQLVSVTAGPIMQCKLQHISTLAHYGHITVMFLYPRTLLLLALEKIIN